MSIGVFHARYADTGSILMYHSVGNNSKFSTVTPEMFEAQIAFLKQEKFEIIALGEMVYRLKNGKSTERSICITFDDGYVDVYENAFPILRKYDATATVFVVSGLIGSKMTTKQGQVFKIISEKQIQEMVDANIDIMPHTQNHPDLTTLDLEVAMNEIEDSKKVIENITVKKAPLFAYPFGRYTTEIVERMQASRLWEGAVTVQPGLVSGSDDMMLLPRNSIDSEVGMFQFKLKVSNGVDTYKKLKSCFQ